MSLVVETEWNGFEEISGEKHHVPENEVDDVILTNAQFFSLTVGLLRLPVGGRRRRQDKNEVVAANEYIRLGN